MIVTDPCPDHPCREAPVKKQIPAVLAAVALAVLAACSTTPTASETAAPSDWQANETTTTSTPADTTNGRIPNMMGSGN
jgi:outer membrane biogenesis lipoprotein LolB